MLAAAEKMSRAIKDHDEYGRWPRQRGTVQIRQPDSRFCLASQGVRRESKFHLKTSNQPTGASDGAAKREQRCRQLTGLTEPPKFHLHGYYESPDTVVLASATISVFWAIQEASLSGPTPRHLHGVTNAGTPSTSRHQPMYFDIKNQIKIGCH